MIDLSKKDPARSSQTERQANPCRYEKNRGEETTGLHQAWLQ
jgi:hypothetical protein